MLLLITCALHKKEFHKAVQAGRSLGESSSIGALKERSVVVPTLALLVLNKHYPYEARLPREGSTTGHPSNSGTKSPHLKASQKASLLIKYFRHTEYFLNGMG